MSLTWRSEDVPSYPPLGVAGIVRALVRGLTIILTLVLGVLATLLIRLVEAPLYGPSRPWSGWVTVWVCRVALRILRLRVSATGRPMLHAGAFVANHTSWLDIFVLNAGAPLSFVAKSEVSGWPGIGWLARVAGTVFVQRSRRDLDRQRALIVDRMSAGQRLLFFPEGTSTDGQRVLRFRPALFAAVLSDRLASAHVQPVTVAYTAPEGVDARFYGWWGDMDFGPHLVQVLAQRGRGRVAVTWHEPLPVTGFADRKPLAEAAEGLVRSGHPHGDVST